MSDKTFDLDFCFAHGAPLTTALFRQSPEDFQVTEIFEQHFAGEGEHHCFWIEKCNENTRWVAKLLAEHFNLPEQAIGFCGLKDRNAITRQWFSAHLPGQTNIAKPELGDNIRLLDYQRHNKKLRRGDHNGNSFVIRLRNCQQILKDNKDDSGTAIALINHRIELIQALGVPNYFGNQRFGHGGNNLLEAEKMLALLMHRQQNPVKNNKRGRRNKRSSLSGIYLSAARSYLFNQVLSQRINTGGWNALVEDSGPLWGRGRSQASEQLQQREAACLEPWKDWLTALEFTGLSQDRRALAVRVKPITAAWDNQSVVLSFTLGSGEYATSVLREITLLDSPQKLPVI